MWITRGRFLAHQFFFKTFIIFFGAIISFLFYSRFHQSWFIPNHMTHHSDFCLFINFFQSDMNIQMHVIWIHHTGRSTPIIHPINHPWGGPIALSLHLIHAQIEFGKGNGFTKFVVHVSFFLSIFIFSPRWAGKITDFSTIFRSDDLVKCLIAKNTSENDEKCEPWILINVNSVNFENREFW